MEHLRLDDGREVRVRPIRPSDGPLLLSLFWRMSPASRYRRFFCPMLTVSGNLVEYLTTVDHHEHEALVALDDTDGAIVGEARYIRSHDDPAAAELAVTIVDDWQSDGLGTALVAKLVERAREEGVERFFGEVLWENRKMIALLHDLHAGRLEPVGAGAQHFSLELADAAHQ